MRAFTSEQRDKSVTFTDTARGKSSKLHTNYLSLILPAEQSLYWYIQLPVWLCMHWRGVHWLWCYNHCMKWIVERSHIWSQHLLYHAEQKLTAMHVPQELGGPAVTIIIIHYYWLFFVWFEAATVCPPPTPQKQIPRMVKKFPLMMHSAWDYHTWYHNLPKLICRFVLKSSVLFKWIKAQPRSVEQSQQTSCYHGVPSAQAGVLQGALLRRKSQRVLRSLTRWKSLVTMELESL